MKRLPLFFVIFLICSCATQRINQFSTFATAGASYTDAMDKLTKEAGKIAIDTDSELLLKDRDQFTEAQRGPVYIERTKALESLLSVISSFRIHTSLLNSYFTVLSQLAEAKGPVLLADQLSSIVSSLQSIHPALENASFGSSSVKDLVKTASPLLIAAFKKKGLEDELKRNAGTIERELALQSAFLQALSDQMKSDILLIIKLKDFQYVTQPYITTLGVKEAWKDKRREILTNYVSFDVIDKAQSAADALKNSFINLIRHNTNMSDLKLLFTDINAMLNLAEMVQKYSEH
jgi:hypothetical protein